MDKMEKPNIVTKEYNTWLNRKRKLVIATVRKLGLDHKLARWIYRDVLDGKV